ncbi:MAG: DNA-binding protein Alba [Methanomassiliicoccales archaeon]|nr:DNA-binding protein Alba [Methanomassiliicoccales archaeon]
MNEMNTVYIGQKPIMNYVLAVVKQLNGGRSGVLIKARGRSISKAVDVALIVNDRFVENSDVKGIKIETEVLENNEGMSSKVSSIEISVHRS